MKLFVSGITDIETTLAVRGFPVTYYPVDYPFFGIKTVVGGSGYRVARAALALGDEVELTTLIGDDVLGRRITDEMIENGMSVEHVYKYLKNTVESVALQESPFGRRQMYCDLKNVQELYVDADSLREAVGRADVCALLNVNFSRAFIPIARSLGKTVATDVQALSDVNDPFNAEFIECSDILFLSDEGVSSSPEEFMSALIERTSARIVIMGLGADGVLYYERGNGGIKSQKAARSGNIITAGAGAALMAAFLHYYGKYDCAQAVARAQAFCALKLAMNATGGGFPSEADVERKLSER